MKYLLFLMVAPFTLLSYGEEEKYENLYIAVETDPGTYPCILTDSVISGKRKWEGVKTKPFSNSVVRCEFHIPEEEFLKTYEVCYFSGIVLLDNNFTSHLNCSYRYPNYFTAEVGKVDELKGINGMTCQFICKLK
ncbi:hypothetical protein GCM10011348_04850 [Marinobacterium nitratireducens]|uniref:Uncharacterized protein n=1 Tax=Marinobacterium nitratireducens TaxID=518897 RepID=A0A917Z6P9_9GAMM|nr:hypothetical protein [Marinobacterium nitratireducens]GGO76795.1 hypothetical protein GCM10011348_04850 [Marinobacterium nitratireducens]